jgi:hypothetical protein
MDQYSFQEEFANSNKNFRYLIGGRRCGKTTAGVKAVCNLVLKGGSGIIIAPRERILSIKNKIFTEIVFSDKIIDWQNQVEFLSIEDNLTGITADWIWLNKTTMYDEWRIWSFLISRLRNYPTGETLIITEEKSLLSALINKEKYNMILMDWDELNKFDLMF